LNNVVGLRICVMYTGHANSQYNVLKCGMYMSMYNVLMCDCVGENVLVVSD
jgi:hypothetical protein